MKKWLTEIRALEVKSGQMKTWGGDEIEASTFELAQKWCDENKGYLKVIGELIVEIPCKPGTYEPDFNKKVDHEIIASN